MKRLAVFILIFIFSLSLISCGGSSNNKAEKNVEKKTRK